MSDAILEPSKLKTLKDQIFELGMTNVYVHGLLVLHQRGELTWEDALGNMVIVLARTCDQYRDTVVELIQESKKPRFPFPDES